MERLSEQAAELLRRPILAFVTTVRRDGSLHSTIVWVDEDNGMVLWNTAVGRAKERNLRRDPRLSVSLVDPDDGFHTLSVAGKAQLELEGANEVMDRLMRKYTGRTYGGPQPGEQRITVRVVPEHVLYNAGRGG